MSDIRADRQRPLGAAYTIECELGGGGLRSGLRACSSNS